VQIPKDDRGFLLSKMSDAGCASMLCTSVKWVQKGRAFLAEEKAAALLAADNRPLTAEIPPAAIAPTLQEHCLEGATRHGYLGAPLELKGAALAEWLYDNTEATLANIGAITGLTMYEIKAIADGTYPTQAEIKPVQAPKASPAMSGPKPAKRPPAPRKTAAVATLAEIPASTLRYARWFRAADWSLREVAFLFDLPRDALVAALG
jgi:hypothetical protein